MVSRTLRLLSSLLHRLILFRVLLTGQPHGGFQAKGKLPWVSPAKGKTPAPPPLSLPFPLCHYLAPTVVTFPLSFLFLFPPFSPLSKSLPLPLTPFFPEKRKTLFPSLPSGQRLRKFSTKKIRKIRKKKKTSRATLAPYSYLPFLPFTLLTTLISVLILCFYQARL